MHLAVLACFNMFVFASFCAFWLLFMSQTLDFKQFLSTFKHFFNALF